MPTTGSSFRSCARLHGFIGRSRLPVFCTDETHTMNRAVCGGSDPDAFAWHVIDERSKVEIGKQSWSSRAPIIRRDARLARRVRRAIVRLQRGIRAPRGRPTASSTTSICSSANASYTREREPEGIQHLSARQAGALARDTRVGQLVLTHQLPGADVDAHAREGADAFGRPVSVAHEHVVYTV